MKYLFIVVLSFILTACGGYKPAPKYAKDIFEQPVLVKVKLDPEDPKSGVFLQDEITRMAVNRLNLTLTKNVNEAKNYIVVNSYTINTTPLNYDENGNIIRYSVNAAIEFAIKDKYGFWSKNIVASEYVNVNPDSLASALDKEKAGKVAIQKALDSFIVAMMQRSQKVGEDKNELNAKKEKYEESNKQPQTPALQTVTQERVSEDGTYSNAFTPDSNQTTTNNFEVNIVPTNSNIAIEDATIYK